MAKLIEGDLFEIAAREKYYYIQFVGVHKRYGETIAVAPESFNERVIDPILLFENPKCYLIFYPLKTTVRNSLTRPIGNGSCRFGVPQTLRRPGRVDPGPIVANWLIDEPDGSTRITERLSESEKLITLGAGWNHEMLLNRIDQKWHPTMYA